MTEGVLGFPTHHSSNRRPESGDLTMRSTRKTERQFEKLEERRLMAVIPTWTQAGGILEVAGDANANEIVVYSENVGGKEFAMVDSPDGTVIFDGRPTGKYVEAREVLQLKVSGAGGNDTVNLLDTGAAAFTG